MLELEQLPFQTVGLSCTVVAVMLLLGFLCVAASFWTLSANSFTVDQGPFAGHHPIVQLVLNSTPLIDGHNDLAETICGLKMNLSGFNLEDDLTKVEPWASEPSSQTDIPRLRKGGVGAQFWSVYISCDFQYENAVQATMDQMDLVKRFISKYSNDFQLATSADDVDAAFAAGKIASLIGVEGGHSIDSSLAVLRLYYELGTRYLTLTHNCNTPWADCCLSNEKPEFYGLSDFGKTIITELNRLGMLIDLAHVSFDTMRDALNVSQAPVIFSHSSAYSICNNSRNVPDDILQQVAINDGIVMVNFYPPFVSCSDNATLSQVADHVEHIRNVAGEDHVGIGADFNGIDLVPVGLEDTSKYPFLLDELVRRGWTQQSLEKLVGKNILRVLRAVETVRDNLKVQGVGPDEARIPFIEIANRSECNIDLYA